MIYKFMGTYWHEVEIKPRPLTTANSIDSVGRSSIELFISNPKPNIEIHHIKIGSLSNCPQCGGSCFFMFEDLCCNCNPDPQSTFKKTLTSSCKLCWNRK